MGVAAFSGSSAKVGAMVPFVRSGFDFGIVFACIHTVRSTPLSFNLLPSCKTEAGVGRTGRNLTPPSLTSAEDAPKRSIEATQVLVNTVTVRTVAAS